MNTFQRYQPRNGGWTDDYEYNKIEKRADQIMDKAGETDKTSRQYGAAWFEAFDRALYEWDHNLI